MAWASVAKEKRERRKRERAGRTYAPRGRSSQLHQDVREVKARIDAEEAAQMAGVPPVHASRGADPQSEGTE
jgi:hypothetical protein